MINKTAADAWFALANFHQARLLTCNQTTNGYCRVSQVDAIESPIPLYRTSTFDGTRVGSNYSYVDNLNTVEEERRRFVRQLARWINTLFKQRTIKHLTIFAPPNSIEYLREQISQPLLDRIDLRRENLMHLTDDVLRRHPAITSLLIPQPQLEPSQRIDLYRDDKPYTPSHKRVRGDVPMHAAR